METLVVLNADIFKYRNRKFYEQNDLYVTY
jgi:hypothetical protein